MLILLVGIAPSLPGLLPSGEHAIHCLSCTDDLCRHTEHEGSHDQYATDAHLGDQAKVKSHHDHSNVKGEASLGCGCQNSELFTLMQHLKYRPGGEVSLLQFASKYEIEAFTISSGPLNISNEVFRPPIG